MQTYEAQLNNEEWVTIPIGTESVTLVDGEGRGNAYWRFAGDTTKGILFSKELPVSSPVDLEVRAVPHNMIAKFVRV